MRLELRGADLEQQLVREAQNERTAAALDGDAADGLHRCLLIREIHGIVEVIPGELRLHHGLVAGRHRERCGQQLVHANHRALHEAYAALDEPDRNAQPGAVQAAALDHVRRKLEKAGGDVAKPASRFERCGVFLIRRHAGSREREAGCRDDCPEEPAGIRLHLVFSCTSRS